MIQVREFTPPRSLSACYWISTSVLEDATSRQGVIGNMLRIARGKILSEIAAHPHQRIAPEEFWRWRIIHSGGGTDLSVVEIQALVFDISPPSEEGS